MKKAFAMPKIVVEQFVPNEYVAACGDENKVYLFECDSGRDFMNIFGFSIDAWGDVFLDDGTNLTPGGGYYHPCGETHEASTTDDFQHGYFVLNAGNDRQTIPILGQPYQKVEVIVWRGPNGNNVHCTTKLDIDSWTTTKS